MSYIIPRDSWAIIERVIRRYPESKKELEIFEKDIILSSPVNDGQPKGSGTGDPTYKKAEKIASDKKLDRIRREVQAVESAYTIMIPEYQKVIRIRFWSNRWKNMRYNYMQISTSYQEAQLKRICGAFIRKVGENLGEL